MLSTPVDKTYLYYLPSIFSWSGVYFLHCLPMLVHTRLINQFGQSSYIHPLYTFCHYIFVQLVVISSPWSAFTNLFACTRLLNQFDKFPWFIISTSLHYFFCQYISFTTPRFYPTSPSSQMHWLYLFFIHDSQLTPNHHVQCKLEFNRRGT